MTQRPRPAPRRRGRALLSASAAAVGLSVAIAVAAPGGNDRGRPGEGGGPDGSRTFDITGSVTGLLPTVERVLPLRLENPDRTAISVVSLEVEIGDPDGACAADELVLRLPALPILVPAQDEVTVNVVATLADDVDDACQGAVWPLAWTGTAERA